MQTDLFDVCKKCFEKHTRSVSLIFLVTAILWILLVLDYLPTYEEKEHERFISLLFPLWVILFFVGFAYIERDIDSKNSRSQSLKTSKSQ